MKQLLSVFEGKWQWLVVVVVVGFLSLFYIQKQYFLTADLGRHIKNGEYILATGKIPATNLYSFSEPDFPALNHHWASGVIYYLVQSCCGFGGLHLFSIAVYVAAIVAATMIASQRARPVTIAAVMLVAVPFTVWRNEIRPEEFSYLLLMVYAGVILGVKRGKLKNWWLWMLPLLQIVWINLHVFFVLGVGLVGLGWLDEGIKYRFKMKNVWVWTWVLIVAITANLINPFGVAGILNPLVVDSKNLANVTETQSVFELLKHLDRMDFVEFVVVVVASWYGIYELAKKYRLKKYRFELGIVLTFGVLGMWMVRNMAMFGLMLIAVGPEMVEEVGRFKVKGLRLKEQMVAAIIILLIIGLGLAKHDWLYSPFKLGEEFGVGLRTDETKPAEFIKRVDIKGPWYNNFDIGSYLIYYFYPDEKVFIDNRPEAYSVNFFKGDYIVMHQDENKWGEMVNRYQFNAIIADYQDNTSWLRPFLQRRYRDPMWALVYQDENVVILVRRDEQNQDIIDDYEISDMDKE